MTALTRHSWARLGVIFGVVALGAPTAQAIEASQFQSRAVIAGEAKAGSPARADIPVEVVEGARPSLADLRILDDQGRETPYVIYAHEAARQEKASIEAEVVDYAEVGMSQYIVVEFPEGSPAIEAIYLKTPQKDFQASVSLHTAQSRLDLASPDWAPVAKDVIFDFSSRVALRRARVDLPEATSARFIQLGVHVAEAQSQGEAHIRAEEGGLFFALPQKRKEKLKFSGIYGVPAKATPEQPVYDTVRRPATGITSEKGITSLPLGPLTTPMSWVELSIPGGYFHREVEVWGASPAAEPQWRRVTTQSIYRIPGMTRAQSRVTVEMPKGRLVELRIRDEDSPPLDIREVTVGFHRRAVYFIPEAGRSYAAVYGGPDLPLPRYDTAMMIARDPAERMACTQLKVKAPQPNPAYDPNAGEPNALDQAQLERWAFTAVISALVVVLAVWGFSLTRKLGQ